MQLGGKWLLPAPPGNRPVMAVALPRPATAGRALPEGGSLTRRAATAHIAR
jgi:hypothetical protein